jgi:hypothetical protein
LLWSFLEGHSVGSAKCPQRDYCDFSNTSVTASSTSPLRPTEVFGGTPLNAQDAAILEVAV